MKHEETTTDLTMSNDDDNDSIRARGASQLSFVASSQDSNNNDSNGNVFWDKKKTNEQQMKTTTTTPKALTMRKIPIRSTSSKKRRRAVTTPKQRPNDPLSARRTATGSNSRSLSTVSSVAARQKSMTSSSMTKTTTTTHALSRFSSRSLASSSSSAITKPTCRTNKDRRQQQKRQRGVPIVPGKTFLAATCDGSSEEHVEDDQIPTTKSSAGYKRDDNSKTFDISSSSSSSSSDEDEASKNKVLASGNKKKRAKKSSVLSNSKHQKEALSSSHRKHKPKAAASSSRTTTKDPVVYDVDSNSNSSDSDEHDAHDDAMIATQDLEVPYAQKLGLPGEKVVIAKSANSSKRKEPLRPGDVIQYDNPIFVAGTMQAKRITQVLATNPKQAFPLELDNGELLEADTRIKRIKEYMNGELYDHPGILRSIDQFRFGTKSLSAKERQKLPSLRRHVSRLMDQVIAKAQDALEKIPENLMECDDDDDDDDGSSAASSRSSSSSSSSGIDSYYMKKSRFSAIKDPTAKQQQQQKYASKITKGTHPLALSSSRSTKKLMNSSSSSKRKIHKRQHQQLDSPGSLVDHSDDFESGVESSAASSISIPRSAHSSRSPMRDQARSANQSGATKPSLGLSRRNSGTRQKEAPSTGRSRNTTVSKQDSHQRREYPGLFSPAKSASNSRKANKTSQDSRRRKSSIESLGKESIEGDKNELLDGDSSSDYDSVSSSILVQKEKEQKEERMRSHMMLGLTRQKSPDRSARRKPNSSARPPPVPASSRDTQQQPGRTTSVMRPTSLEPEITAFCDTDSSEDENWPENGSNRSKFFPSALQPPPREQQEDSDHISIASYRSNSQSPAVNSQKQTQEKGSTTVKRLLKKKFLQKRHDRLDNGTLSARSAKAPTGNSAMQLSFQKVPTSGSRLDH